MAASTRPREACPTVYGPVASRRHGRSLGINLGRSDRKICTWGCLYCQCGIGRTREFEENDARPSEDAVLAQVRESLFSGDPIDSITFAGNSEPTTHPRFGAIVRGLLGLRRMMGGHWILNCLSNGSELENPGVLDACDLLDEIWIKLDCAQEALFQRLNRPLARTGTLEDHLSRIHRLARPCLQTLVWKSPEDSALANWTEPNREALLQAYARVRPHRIHLTTLARTPASLRLKPVPAEELTAFADRIRSQGLPVESFG